MPCYDPRDLYNPPKEIYKDNPATAKERDYFEAVCCALINEAKRRDILDDFINNAESNGAVEIWPFLEKHEKKDTERVMDKLNRVFSFDELLLIKKELAKPETKE